MTTKRRIDRVEAHLSPIEMVNKVLDEINAFSSVTEYTRSIIDLPDSEGPLSRVCDHAEAVVRARMRGRPPAEIERAVDREVRDAAFRFILILVMSETADRMAQLEGLLATALTFYSGKLLAGPEPRVDPMEVATYLADWRQWASSVATIVARVECEETARSILTARFLGGHTCLFVDTQIAWDRMREHVDTLRSLAASEYVRLVLHEFEPGRGWFDGSPEDVAVQRADTARVRTYGRFGDMSRALAILADRIRS